MGNDKPTVAVIARFWNAQDLVWEWFEAVKPWADHVYILDAGSTDGTWGALQDAAETMFLNFPGGIYRLPPGAPMRSGLWLEMLLRQLDAVKPDLFVDLDHDEFVEPEIVNFIPEMVADTEHDCWALPRRNFVYSRTHYSAARNVITVKGERVFMRWFPGLHYPQPAAPTGRKGEQGIHHVERVPLGHPAAKLIDPARLWKGAVPNWDRIRTLPIWLLHYSLRDPARSAQWADRLKDQTGEDWPNLRAAPEAFEGAKLVEYVPYAERHPAAETAAQTAK